MSKAIKRAKERYWLEPNNIETQEKYAAYVEGYHQAEKDLELIWEDISDIIEIHEDVLEMESCENVYMEVLRRFKERKEK
jgi:hypothetical protein